MADCIDVEGEVDDSAEDLVIRAHQFLVPVDVLDLEIVLAHPLCLWWILHLLQDEVLQLELAESLLGVVQLIVELLELFSRELDAIAVLQTLDWLSVLEEVFHEVTELNVVVFRTTQERLL